MILINVTHVMATEVIAAERNKPANKERRRPSPCHTHRFHDRGDDRDTPSLSLTCALESQTEELQLHLQQALLEDRHHRAAPFIIESTRNGHNNRRPQRTTLQARPVNTAAKHNRQLDPCFPIHPPTRRRCDVRVAAMNSPELALATDQSRHHHVRKRPSPLLCVHIRTGTCARSSTLLGGKHAAPGCKSPSSSG